MKTTKITVSVDTPADTMAEIRDLFEKLHHTLTNRPIAIDALVVERETQVHAQDSVPAPRPDTEQREDSVPHADHD